MSTSNSNLTEPSTPSLIALLGYSGEGLEIRDTSISVPSSPTYPLSPANAGNASKNANLAVRIDEDFRPWWEELNSLRKKIQTGASSVKNNNYESALQIFSELFVKYPNYPEVPYYLAMTYYKQKKYKQASKYFQKALDLYPDYQKAKKALNNVKKRTQN